MFFLRFQQLCNEVNKSTTAVAQELGVSKSTVSYWRNTEGAIPKQEVIAKITEYFNVSIDYLLGNTDIKSPQSTSEDDEKDNFSLSAHEKTVVIAYRSKPEMQPAVDKLLGIDAEESTEIIKIAARDGSFTETTITNSDIENINNLPDVDDI